MRHEESKIQIAAVRWFRFEYPNLARLLFSVPNGGKRPSAITGAILKAEGAVAGVSDLILLKANSQYHALCIEMKTETGRQSESQKLFQAAVEAQGYKYIICHSLKEFIDEVQTYLRTDEERNVEYMWN